MAAVTSSENHLKFKNAKHVFELICSTGVSGFQSFKARANARNIVGPNMLRAFAHHVVCCCVLLQLVGSCWMKFETGQTSEPTSASISIVSRSSKRGPTMLRSFAQHIQQCCAGARALHATYPHKYMRTRNQHGVGDGKRPRVLCILI